MESSISFKRGSKGKSKNEGNQERDNPIADNSPIQKQDIMPPADVARDSETFTDGQEAGSLKDRASKLESDVFELKSSMKEILGFLRTMDQRGQPSQASRNIPEARPAGLRFQEQTSASETEGESQRVSDLKTPVRSSAKESIHLDTRNYGWDDSDGDRRKAPKHRREMRGSRSSSSKSSKHRRGGGGSDSSSSSSSEGSESDSQESDASSSSSEDSRDRKRRGRKSLSVIDTLRGQDKYDGRASNVIRSQPDYSKIELKKAYVSSILNFSDQLIRYQRDVQTTLRATTLVDTEVKDKIMAKCRSIRSDRKFYDMSNTMLFKKLQKLVRTLDVDHLILELERNVTFTWGTGSKMFWNFDEFYSKYIIFVDKFRRTYKFLTEHNSRVTKDLKWENKPNTVIKVFIDKLGEYGRKVWNRLPKSKFAGFEDFLTHFGEVCVEHKRVAEKARLVATCYFPEEAGIQRKRTPFTRPGFTKGTPDARPGVNQIAMKSPHGDTYAFEGAEESEYNDEGDIGDSEQAPDPKDNEQDTEPDRQADSPLESQEPDTWNNQPDPTLAAVPVTGVKIVKRPFGAPSSIAPRPSAPSASNNACFAWATKGRCDRIKCTYSHDETACAKMRAELITNLQARNKEMASKKTGPGASISAIRDLNTEDMVQEEFIMDMIPELSLSRSVFHQGVVRLISNEGTTSIPVEALFDSGSLQASFVSKTFLDRDPAVWRDRITPSIGHATLADKVTKVGILGTVQVPCTFAWKGREFSQEIKCHVVDTLSTEMIVGLPHIILHFLELFVSMLETAVERAMKPQDTALGVNAVHAYGNEDFIAEEKEPGELYEPWTFIDEEAPEDDDIGLPCSFSFAIHYMEMSHEEAVSEYLAMFDEHVSPEFYKAVPQLRKYLEEEAVKVFVPTNWEGIRIDPITLKWKPTLPERDNIRARPVNPRLMAPAKTEFDRLLNYFYRPSNSPHASALVIAPKATKPFIRFCGDYVKKNDHIERGHFPMPHVKITLEKITRFNVFLDIDWVNAYHQFPLSEDTSRKLSVVTPWGQVEPIFLPEGVSPASEIMQSAVQTIFGDFDEWMIAIYDNILVLAYDFEDAFDKFKKVIARCKEFNVFLKFSKTWLGFPSCEFFGFKCERHKYQLTEKRKNAIMDIPFPDSLGTSVFFHNFVPNFSELVAPLHDMTSKTFVWKPSEWKVDYMDVFERFKTALVNSVELYYPDYNLVWILRTDASETGIGWVLMQLKQINKDPPEWQHQPMIFGAEKFSDQAKKWFTRDQELYGGFKAMKSCDYYLRAKPFIWETDHANLQWMEKATNARVIRMRVFMQGFSFMIRHIPRRQNIVADWQSKFYSYPSSFELSLIQGSDKISELLHQIHGHRGGHHGVARTWELLNEKCPGHRIPYKIVLDFVKSCGICQKLRVGLEHTFEPIVRHLKVPEANSAIGVDGADMEPDKLGNRYLYVIRNLFTKVIGLYPSKDKTDESLARAIFRHLTRFGVVNSIVSDPGSDMTSTAIQLVNQWFGVHHRLSLVNRHESNGVEGGIKDMTRYIVTLCADERHKDRWSDDSIICWVEFIINTMSDNETGVSPYELTFGSKSAVNFRFPEGPFDKSKASSYLRALNDDLDHLRQTSKEYQDKIVAKRTASNDPAHQNVYQKGDFVLYKPRQAIKPSRFSPKFEGPYEVIAQTKNDVVARHVNLGVTKTFYVEDLKIFHGDREDAQKLSLLDQDQYEIDKFLAYRGDPHTRSTMQFLIRFKDATEVWIPWSEDIFNTVQYEEYCRSKPELFQLVFRHNIAKLQISELNKTPIDPAWIGQVVFVDIRSYGATWYEELNLPDKDLKTYVVPFVYEKLERRNSRIVAFCELFNERFLVDHLFVKEYGSNSVFDKQLMKLIDTAMLIEFPAIAPNHTQKRV